MRSLGGFVLLAGVCVGLFVYFPAPVDRSTTLEQATRALEERPAETVVARAPVATATTPSRVASFAPHMRLAAPTQRTRAVAPPAATAKIETIASWETTVAGAASGALEPTDAEGRYKLVVDIQQQLKRVGCYWGRVNGAWNANTREAMREFTSHTNAALPVEKPDYLLLTVLKSHNGRSCGAAQATVAAAAPPSEVLPWKAANAAVAGNGTRLFTPVQTSVVTNEPLPGRMSIGAPKDFPPPNREPLFPGPAPAQPGVATAALEPSASGPSGFSPPPPAAAKPRANKKSASRRASPGTPRYNLMLSLGGVY